MAAGLRYRLTESNDYLVGVPGASDAYASALWALDHLHWWAAHGAAGVNFHNRRGRHGHDRARPGRRRGLCDQPEGLRHQGVHARLGGAGEAHQVRNPDGINVTAYCVGGAGQDYVTVINKAHGADSGDAAVTIMPPGPGLRGAEVITLAGGQPGDARGTTATLGGAEITAGTAWNGRWDTVPADPHAGITLTVKATTAAIVRIHSGG